MSGRRTLAVLIALAVGTFTYVTAETLPVGLLLVMAKDLHTSPSAVGMLVTCYGFVVIVAALPLTHATRHIPRRYLMCGLLAGFVVATALSAASSSYPVLLATRVATALTQAVFWSVVVPTTGSLVPARVRGRALALVLSGTSLAAVVGVPAGTWLGQRAGWRASFLAVSALGLVLMLVVGWLLPTAAPGRSETALGAEPDARRFSVVLVALTIATMGTFTAFTYLAPYLAEVGHLGPGAIGPVLFVRGLAGVAGVVIGGVLYDRTPQGSIGIGVAIQTVALLLLYPFGGAPVAAVGLVGLGGLAFAAFTTSLGSRILQIAPGSTDLAAAAAGVAINVGITGGALLGGLLLPAFGVRSTVLVAGVLSVAGLGIVAAEPLFASRAGPRRPGRVHRAHDGIRNSLAASDAGS